MNGAVCKRNVGRQATQEPQHVKGQNSLSPRPSSKTKCQELQLQWSFLHPFRHRKAFRTHATESAHLPAAGSTAFALRASRFRSDCLRFVLLPIPEPMKKNTTKFGHGTQT